MHMSTTRALLCLLVFFWFPSSVPGQTTYTATTETQLQNALTSAESGDIIRLQANITLTSDLPAIRTDLTLEGGGFTLSGADQFRGLVITQPSEFNGALVVAIENLTIADTVATGGAGGSGGDAGGGGAGLGGALHIGDDVFVTVTDVTISSSAAVGGAGGTTTSGSAGGGGGMGGDGGAGLGDPPFDGGGGGLGTSATGGTGATGAPGSAVGALPGGSSDFEGGTNGGGGGAGFGGGGGGIDGASSGEDGGDGGFGGGGGGSLGVGGNGGVGGGGGGGNAIGGSGGYGGGGGGSAGTPGTGGPFGGNGGTAGAGGGAGLGGAVFVAGSGFLRVIDNFRITGSSVAAGPGTGNGTSGQAFGSGVFLAGSGFLDFDVAAGAVSTIANDIVDETGVGLGDGGSWHLSTCGAGTLVLSGENRYSGGTTVCGGTLQITDERNIGTGDIAVGTGTTLSITGNSSFTNTLFAGSGSTLRVAAGRTVTWNGLIDDAPEDDPLPGNTLHITGGGVLELTNSGNLYSMGTTVGGGSTVRMSHDGALGHTIGTLTLGDLHGQGTLSIATGSAFVSSRTIVLGSTGGGIDTQSGATAVLNGIVTGSGSLTKSGLGTVVLNNAETSYAGATSIEAGILRTGAAGLFSPTARMNVGGAGVLDLNGFSQAVGSLTGSGLVSLGTGTLTVGAADTTSLFGGSISGDGGLAKTGGGLLALTGSNSYTGGTVVTGGVLLGTTDSLQGNIANDATVVFDQSASGTYSGAMSGSGALVKNGSGELTLTGSNSYTGGTAVADGSLRGDTASLQGVVVNDARVVLDQSFDGTFDGTMTGTGILQKAGDGTVTLGGALSHAGGTLVTGGGLIGTTASLRGTIVNDASVTFAGNSGTFEGLLDGIGTFEKTGAGTLTVTGSHAHTGLFAVTGGILALDGALASHVTVGPNAALHARGTIFGPTTVSGLLVVPSPVTPSPGLSGASTSATYDPAPLLTIGGDLSMTPGSRLFLPLGPGSSPSLLVGGVATFTNTTIDVTPVAPLTERSTSFLALAAETGLDLTGTTGTSSDPQLRAILKQDRNMLFVTMLNLGIPLVTDVTNPNARSVSGVLDRLKEGATGDRLTVIEELTGLSDSELDAALRQISGEAHATFLQIGIRDSEAANDVIREQISTRRRDARLGTNLGPSWWAHGGGQRNTLKNGDGDRLGTIDLGSTMAGMDYRPSETWTFGVGGGLAAGTINLTDLASTGDVTSPRAFGYAGWRPKSFGVRGGATFARQEMESRREIAFQSRLPDDLGGDPIGEGIHREAEAEEVTLVKDQWSDWEDEHEIKTYTLSYVLGYRRATFTRRGFVEGGADSLSLEMPEQTIKLRQVNALVNSWRREGDFRPFGEFLYRREVTDGRTTTALEFPDAGDSRFFVDGKPAPKNVVKMRAGATWFTSSATWRFEYEYRNATGQTTHGGALHVRF